MVGKYIVLGFRTKRRKVEEEEEEEKISHIVVLYPDSKERTASIWPNVEKQN